MGKKNKRNKPIKNKQILIKPSKCAKCDKLSIIFICGLCKNCWNGD